MIVADSDVLIDGLRGREPMRQRIDVELRTGHLATTAITVFELLSGAKSPSQETKVAELLRALLVLPPDEQACRTAALIRTDLERQGQGLAMADYLIAGICLSRDAVLLTRNRTHFERVKGLAIGTLNRHY